MLPPACCFCAAIACREGMAGRWAVRPGSLVPGAVTSFGVNSLEACLADCIHDMLCVAAEFTRLERTCKHHGSEIDPTQISSSSSTDLYILSRCT